MPTKETDMAGDNIQYSTSLREEELKNKSAADFFGAFDYGFMKR